MTIPELFNKYPLSILKVAKSLGMCRQQLSVYVNGGNISDRNIKRVNDEINKIGKELSEVKLNK